MFWKELIRLLSLHYVTRCYSVYKNVKLYKITEFCTGWFNICPNITSKYRTIDIFKSFVTQHTNKTYRYAHYLFLHQITFT
jgi:hypothetical protein